MVYYYEGIANLSEEEGAHEKAFHDAVMPVVEAKYNGGKGSCKLFPKEKYLRIMHVVKAVKIDHGVKKLTSIPIIAKRASCVAVALLTIFTEQGPPAILQADNGREFFGSGRSGEDRRVELEDEVSITTVTCVLCFSHNSFSKNANHNMISFFYSSLTV